MNEIWKDIPGYERLYQVSNLGNVKSLSREMWNGVSFWKSKERILKVRKCSNGYLDCLLYDIKRKAKRKRVHRLVMLAFHGPSDLEVNHIDGNKKNNCEWNLEYCTNRENSLHAISTGLIIIKPVIQYDLNGRFIKEWKSSATICNTYNIHRGQISRVCTGQRKTAYGFIWKYKENI